jgi:hypothetical protein
VEADGLNGIAAMTNDENPNDERRTNDETRITVGLLIHVVRASSFLRHSYFVIRHSGGQRARIGQDL